MADNKRMEMIAENLVAHFLQRHDILITKPMFDEDGGDLLAMTPEGELRYCRIQSKGRSLRSGERTEVKIPVSYVAHNYIVCLFLSDGSFDEMNLYIFFNDDIEEWPKTTNQKNYVLRLQYGTFRNKLEPHKISEQAIERIKNEIMKVGLPNTATFKYTATGGITISGEADANQNP